MIHYALRCDAGHGFDGWFAGSAAFDRQCGAGLVECPHCGSAQVARALMAPALGRGAMEVLPPEPKPADKPSAEMPAEVITALQRLRAAVERNCDYVGPDFAETATRMHRGEIQTRAIYGETSAAEAEALYEEGVPVGRIPWVRRADS
jgi:hypothetical protein